MRRLFAIFAVVLGVTALLAGDASGRIFSSSGDRCTVTGNGNGFVLSVTIPARAPRQGGFAIGAAGTTVTLVVITGVSGNDSDAKLPAGTTLAQIDQEALSSGIVDVNVQTNASFSGTFRVVPARFPTTSFLNPISCAVPPPMQTSNVFHAGTTFAWNAATAGWEETVQVPGPGVLAFHSPASKPLIRSNGIVVQHAGNVTLTIKPTPAGTAALAAHGSITLPLTVIFTPNRGAPANKTITATLRRGA